MQLELKLKFSTFLKDNKINFTENSKNINFWKCLKIHNIISLYRRICGNIFILSNIFIFIRYYDLSYRSICRSICRNPAETRSDNSGRYTLLKSYIPWNYRLM